MQKKLRPAVVLFVVLMIVAGYLLDGKVLAMVLVVLGGLLAKILIAAQREKFEAQSADEVDPERMR